MGKLSAYHRYLFLGKITGSLSETEKKELEALFAGDENAVREFDSFVRTLPAEDVSRSFDYLNKQEFWQGHLPREIRRQQSITRRKTILIYSAVAAVLLCIAIPILRPGKNEGPAITRSQPTSPGSVVLTAANGEVIDLNKRSGTIDVAGARFNNKDGILELPASVNASAGTLSVTVPIGKDYRIRLSDGTQVWLNADTRFTSMVSFSGNKREVTIAGEAYLKVATDSARPFIVHLPKSDVEVTGTEFNVNSYVPGMETCALVEGGVQMKTAGAATRLAPGNQALANTNDHTITQEPFNAKKVLSWRTGSYYFESATLDDISAALARWFGVKTKIETPSLKNRRFAGILNKNEPIEDFIDNMRNISHIEIYFDNEGVLHFK